MNIKFRNSVVLGASLLLLSVSSVVAQTSTPSATIRDSVKQKVAEELAQIKKAVAKRAFVGSITEKSEVSLTLSTMKNETRTVNITPDSTVKLISNKDGTPVDLKTGDYILVMGEVDSQNVMTAKRLLVISKPTADPRTVIVATVLKTAPSSLTLTTSKGDSISVKTSSVTKLNDKNKLSDLTPGIKVLVVYNTTSNVASRIHIMKTAETTPTPSGKPGTTPSITPKATAKPTITSTR